VSDYGPAAPVQIFQHEAEFSELLDLYRERNPLNVLEIGSYHGGTLYHWLQNAPAGALVVSVDTYTAADNRNLYEDWVPRGIRLEVIQGDSHDPAIVAQVRKLGPYDWVFIDADHYYDAVLQDWQNYGPMSTDVVCFHDILDDRKHHPEIEVARLWGEIKQDHETREIVSDREAWWGGIGCVFIS
jgi:cephalosporin hydroxylase